jgi:hypothetical protein
VSGAVHTLLSAIIVEEHHTSARTRLPSYSVERKDATALRALSFLPSAETDGSLKKEF